MRALLLLPALMFATACGEKDAPEETMPEVIAPAALTAADVAGGWTGMTMAPGSDSVVSNWTVSSTSDSTGTMTIVGMAEPIMYTWMVNADSLVATSMPYVDPAREDGMMVKWRSVGRMDADGGMTGTSQTMVVGSDSVVATGRWHMNRTPM